MKKLTNNISPFTMLLIPVFVLTGLLALHSDDTIPETREQSTTYRKMPENFFKHLINLRQDL